MVESRGFFSKTYRCDWCVKKFKNLTEAEKHEDNCDNVDEDTKAKLKESKEKLEAAMKEEDLEGMNKAMEDFEQASQELILRLDISEAAMKEEDLEDITISRSSLLSIDRKSKSEADNERAEAMIGHLDDKPGSRHVDYYPDSKQITRMVIERLMRNTGWGIEKEGTTVWPGWWKGGQQKPKPSSPHLIYAKTGKSLRNMQGERIIVNTKRKTITSEARYRNVYGKNKSNVNKLKELINKELERDRLAEEERELEEREKQSKITNARDKEEHLDYDGAIAAYEEIGDKESAKRVRRLKADLAAPKTEIHGDYVDDRDTIVKDSVVNRSNIGAGGDDKVAKLEKIANLKREGLIDDAEFQQMKKEILGK